MQQTSGAKANALKRELVIAAEASGRASVEQVYDVLRISGRTRPGPASARRRADGCSRSRRLRGRHRSGRSSQPPGRTPWVGSPIAAVVTEATRPSAFEFVTEAHLQTKKGKVADWTNVHRYELTPTSEGCRVVYTIRVTRISSLPGMLGLFNAPVLSGLARKAAAGVGRRGVRNLVALAEERAGLR